MEFGAWSEEVPSARFQQAPPSDVYVVCFAGALPMIQTRPRGEHHNSTLHTPNSTLLQYVHSHLIGPGSKAVADGEAGFIVFQHQAPLVEIDVIGRGEAL